MPETTTDTGRTGQRRRTRDAILAAAASLLAAGHTPSVGEVADAAEVSRRTVYMYFPTLEQLLIDATLGTVSRETVDAAIDAADDDDDVQARVERMARAVQRLSAATEQQGRTLMRLTAITTENPDARVHPPRGYRRVQWIERALAPLRPRLDAPHFERLVTSLSMVLGWEALIVQRDIRGLSLAEAEDASAWASRALVAAAIAEIGESKPARAPVRRRPAKKARTDVVKKRSS
jgi:AcrR family transcriptional regulator